jgi:hypothetical protein
VSGVEIFKMFESDLSDAFLSHFKVDDVSALEPSSKPQVRIVEDGVTASTTYAMTLVTALMP